MATAVFVYVKNGGAVEAHYFQGAFPDSRLAALLATAAANQTRKTGATVTPEELTAFKLTGDAAQSVFKAPARAAEFNAAGELINVAAGQGTPEVWLHVELTGGDGQEPLGLANSGSEARSFTAAFALRTGPDPAAPVIQVSDHFRMRLRDKATGAVVRVKMVHLTDGQGSVTVNIADGSAEGELVLDEGDFVLVAGARVRLAQPVTLVIYEP